MCYADVPILEPHGVNNCIQCRYIVLGPSVPQVMSFLYNVKGRSGNLSDFLRNLIRMLREETSLKSRRLGGEVEGVFSLISQKWCVVAKNVEIVR